MGREVDFDKLAEKINKNVRSLNPTQLDWLNVALKASESPMERLLASALASNEYLPSCQFTITPYRLDFAFIQTSLCIEVDGERYHSSKKQRLKDNVRDRFLVACGWRILRFTGSEVWKNSTACAEEVSAIHLALSE